MTRCINNCLARSRTHGSESTHKLERVTPWFSRCSCGTMFTAESARADHREHLIEVRSPTQRRTLIMFNADTGERVFGSSTSEEARLAIVADLLDWPLNAIRAAYYEYLTRPVPGSFVDRIEQMSGLLDSISSTIDKDKKQ